MYVWAPVGRVAGLYTYPYDSVQTTWPEIFAADAEGDYIQIPGNLSVWNPDEPIYGVGLQKRLLVHVEGLRGNEGLTILRGDVHA